MTSTTEETFKDRNMLVEVRLFLYLFVKDFFKELRGC